MMQAALDKTLIVLKHFRQNPHRCWSSIEAFHQYMRLTITLPPWWRPAQTQTEIEHLLEVGAIWQCPTTGHLYNQKPEGLWK
ncbi:MAG: hypothetical protein ACPGVO_04430 [Spirulinaceae cyanobacterium]